MTIQTELWCLHHSGVIVWAARFKPRRRKYGRDLSAFWAWTDCNGVGPIEGSLKAKLSKCVAVLMKKV